VHGSYLQLGQLHIPVFGAAAVVGLIAALGLSQRTARYAGLEPVVAWDAGMVAVIAAFVLSRALLIVFNLHSFLMYPLLVMAVPSLTGTGVALTAVFLAVYLRWKRLPALRLLDAMAPCGALLWAFLSLGRVLDGTMDGMPTSVAWGIAAPGIAGAKVHPVEFYTLLVAASLCLVLLGVVMQRGAVGATAGWGLLLSGVAVFLLDFFRVPSVLFELSWMDPAQFLGVGMVVVGGLILARRFAQGYERESMGAGHAV
jgi:phosphatidylglycerol:prolipoprotein diacylglycerol transferase